MTRTAAKSALTVLTLWISPVTTSENATEWFFRTAGCSTERYGNLRYGNENATEEEVIAAAKAAYAHSFIRRMSDGYNTVISEDGR